MKKILGIIIVIFLVGIASAELSSTGYQPNMFSSDQYYQPSYQQVYSQYSGYYGGDLVDYNQFFTKTDLSEQCQGRQDFIVNIRPGGCTPMVVRSDLLEEQNVPVFCTLDALKLNPLIDVAAVKSVSFKGSYPKEVAAVSWHPSQAALRIYNPVLSNPLLNDIGYVVVVLKRIESEREMPEKVNLTLTASLRYDMQNIFGAGKPSYYLPVLEDSEWSNSYEEYGFWKGKGYVRAEEVSGDRATIGIYTSKDQRLSSVSLRVGESSDLRYLPFSYCSAGIKVKLDAVTSEKPTLKLRIDDEEVSVVEGQDLFGGVCRVLNLKASYGGSGSFSLRCNNGNYNFELNPLKSIKMQLKTDVNSIQTVQLGRSFNTGVDTQHLVYVGNGIIDGEKKLFAIFAKNVGANYLSSGNIKDSTLSLFSSSFDEWMKRTGSSPWQSTIKTKAQDQILKGADVTIVPVEGELGNYIFSQKINIQETSTTTQLESYFAEAKNSAYDVVRLYGSERDINGYYGAQALKSFANLADSLGKQETARQARLDIIDKYPDSDQAKKVKLEMNSANFYNYDNAAKYITVSGVNHAVTLLQVRKPSLDQVGAVFEIDSDKGDLRTFQIGDYVLTNDEEYAKITDLSDTSVTFEYKRKPASTDSAIVRTETRTRGQSIDIGFSDSKSLVRQTAVLSDINVRKVAQVQIISESQNGQTDVNVSFAVGIEKRLVQLSPNKTVNRVKALNESIARWNKTVTSLGRVVKVMKAGCFAGASALMIKNFFSSLSGDSLARTKVMDGYWRGFCQQEISKTGESMDECYAKHNSEIQASVKEMAARIKQSNTEMEARAEGITEKSFLGLYQQVDTDELRNKLVQGDFTDYVYQHRNDDVVVDGKKMKLGQVFDPSNSGDKNRIRDNINRSNIGVSDMRDIMLYGGLNSDGTSTATKGLGATQLSLILPSIEKDVSRVDGQNSYKSAFESAGISADKLNSDALVNSNQRAVVTTNLRENQLSGISSPAGKYLFYRVPNGKVYDQEGGLFGTPSTKAFYNNNVLLIPVTNTGNELVTGFKSSSSSTQIDYKEIKVLKDNGGGSFVLDTSVNGNGILTEQQLQNVKNSLGIGSFAEINTGKCENRYLNPEVRYFESEPSKGMPAMVPIDLKRGWYAAVKQVIPGIGQSSATKSYQSSGAVTSLWLCNVGGNGLEEWDKTLKDDDCIQLNYETGQISSSGTDIPCIADRNEATRLATFAKKTVESVASQYGKDKVSYRTYDGSLFEKKAKAALKSPGLECQQFMSPQDCQILFNLCDPVLCPTSRCDFGGRFPVDDVVASGVVGGVMLCLPNFNIDPTKGVVIPVCLSGIQAGLDAYVQLLKDHRDCLQENINSGRMIGICDEIYSLYSCEFFWKQIAPLTKELVPRFIELLTTGKQTRGGGEYLTIQDSWKNTQNSINYFTNFYGVNSFKAFQARSTSDVGSEICKGFISTNFPTSKEALNKLLEPDSPVQFQAWFDETTYSDITVPATSSYKVYYHIYSGKDAGHYYQVYLKSPPETGYYSQSPTVTVESGYVGIGQTIDKTKDFTAPAGYKELCVRIDSNEKCGFKQVTTSFALNEIKDRYMSEQASEQISSEKDCISGTTSIYSMAQPNLQSGVEEALTPAIYERGIIRVCSTMSPDYSSNSSRWKKVGYCDKENTGCWLDQESVKSVIQDRKIENDTLKSIEQLDLQAALESGKKWDQNLGSSVISELKKKVDAINENSDISSLPSDARKLSDSSSDYGTLFREIVVAQDKSYFNNQIGQAYMLQSGLFDKLTRAVKKQYVPPATPQKTSSDEGANDGSLPDIECLAVESCEDYELFDMIHCGLNTCYPALKKYCEQKNENCVDKITPITPVLITREQAVMDLEMVSSGYYSLDLANPDYDKDYNNLKTKLAGISDKIVAAKLLSQTQIDIPLGLEDLGKASEDIIALLNKITTPVSPTVKTYKLGSVVINGRTIVNTPIVGGYANEEVSISVSHDCDGIAVLRVESASSVVSTQEASGVIVKAVTQIKQAPVVSKYIKNTEKTSLLAVDYAPENGRSDLSFSTDVTGIHVLRVYCIKGTTEGKREAYGNPVKAAVNIGKARTTGDTGNTNNKISLQLFRDIELSYLDTSYVNSMLSSPTIGGASDYFRMRNITLELTGSSSTIHTVEYELSKRNAPNNPLASDKIYKVYDQPKKNFEVFIQEVDGKKVYDPTKGVATSVGTAINYDLAFKSKDMDKKETRVFKIQGIDASGNVVQEFKSDNPAISEYYSGTICLSSNVKYLKFSLSNNLGVQESIILSTLVVPLDCKSSNLAFETEITGTNPTYNYNYKTGWSFPRFAPSQPKNTGESAYLPASIIDQSYAYGVDSLIKYYPTYVYATNPNGIGTIKVADTKIQDNLFGFVKKYDNINCICQDQLKFKEGITILL